MIIRYGITINKGDDMARLTKAIKEKILHNALAKASVFERELDIKNMHSNLAESVRLYAIGGASSEKEIMKCYTKIKEMMGKIPECVSTSGYYRMSKQKGVKASFGGMQVNLYYNGIGESHEHEYKSPAPEMLGRPIMFDLEHDFTSEFHSMNEEAKKVKDLRQSITVNVNAMLDSVTTDKRLIEIWPESKELIPTEIEKKKVQLPSTSVDQLNTMIGIPSNE